MDTTYKPAEIETRWYAEWEKAGYFAPADNGTPYSIAIPPPNVTGSLHMGHAFQHSIMDALIRYQRMRGNRTLWQVGTDHAGIATQMVVERKLAAEEGKTRHDLGRDAFTDRIWDWKAESGGTITGQMRRLGTSVDWDTERFTMDEGFSNAVREAFVRLYEDGLIYRGKRLVNWDPALQTAISDLEVENHDVNGHLWHLRYPLADGVKTADGLDYLTVATTRPETLLGDAAVAVHPEDERYRKLIGKFVTLPLVSRRLPVIADPYVDREFGSGCVKITPAHDFNDYDMGRRHNLPLINVLDTVGAILPEAECYDIGGKPRADIDTALPADYAGVDRFDARKKIVLALEELDLLERIEDHKLKVPKGDRSGKIIEPLLTDQWFVATEKLATDAIAAVENGDIEFVPKQYENMYFAWMRNIQDWCVSRQLWWGHRIPAWYDKDGNFYVGRDEAEARAAHGLSDAVELRQDDDVLDTWFSSALWTFGTLGWPEDTARLRDFHPTDVLVTGFDIIFFWVARMIMFTLHFMKNPDGSAQVPFKTVYVTGLIRDESGQKMSKSKGNVIDPLDMIDGISLDALLEKRCGSMMQPQLAEKIGKRTRKAFPEGIAPHGTDALRFTLFSLASTGRDINWDMKRLEGYRNFCNKIWNAARYVLMNTEAQQSNNVAPVYSLADRWIQARLQQCIGTIDRAFGQYRFDRAATAVYEFIWNDYCDWYVELTKPVLLDESADPALLAGTRATLLAVLETTLRIAHPFMPFITEDIWQRVAPLTGINGDSIMLAPWPAADTALVDEAALDDIAWLQAVILAVRSIRAAKNIAPGEPLKLILRNPSADDERRLAAQRLSLLKIARLNDIECVAAGTEIPLAAAELAGDLEVLVPMADLIDPAAEKLRISSEMAKQNKEIQRLTGKLGNAGFTGKAPAAVVEKEKLKLATAERALQTLQKQYDALPD